MLCATPYPKILERVDIYFANGWSTNGTPPNKCCNGHRGYRCWSSAQYTKPDHAVDVVIEAESAVFAVFTTCTFPK